MRLTRNIGLIINVDSAKGIETIRQITPKVIPGIIIISLKNQAFEEANTLRRGQIMWSDGSRLENGRIDVVAIGLDVSGTWKSKMSVFGDNKEVFDAELWGIYLAL